MIPYPSTIYEGEGILFAPMEIRSQSILRSRFMAGTTACEELIVVINIGWLAQRADLGADSICPYYLACGGKCPVSIYG